MTAASQSRWFVSGHLDLTEAEFDQHYAPKIREAAYAGGDFVVGDAPGCDTMAQRLLSQFYNQPGVCPAVRVYHMLENPRNLVDRTFRLMGGYASDELRDAAMTRASDFDIAWVRPGKRKNNGTARNLARRLEWDREQRRDVIASWPEFKYVSSDDCTGYLVYPPDDVTVEFIQDRCRLPKDLVDREAAAWRAYAQLRDEITQLIREQQELEKNK